MLFGWIEPGQLPSSGFSLDYTPLGSADGSVGNFVASPNSTVVLRDLFVRVQNPPGATMARWEMTLQSVSQNEELTCQIVGNFATTCDSAGQTATVPPGGNIRVIVENVGGAAATFLYYAYRAGGP